MATPNKPTRSVVLVLGMHRSGTSAVAAGLEQLGVVMGSSLLQGDEWNPKGYFEEKQIVEFNNRLLDLCGLRWDSTAPSSIGVEPAWANEIEPASDLLQAIFGGIHVWGLKDPRMCLLGSFWKKVLAAQGVTPRLLMVLRDPAEVANSLARRDGIAVERAAWLWFNHLLGSFEYVAQDSDLRLVDFAELLRAPAATLRGLAEWLDLQPDERVIESFASEFISPQLSHGAAAAALEMPPLVVRAFTYWQVVAAQGATVAEALNAPEWLQIKRAFEVDIQPQLVDVQRFFDGDRQLSVMETRLSTLSRALAVTEALAFDRLDQILTLDSQLKQTSGALAFAEKLALQRQEQIERAAPSSQEHAQLLLCVENLSAGLANSEKLAFERLATIEQLDAQIKETSLALARAEQCVLDIRAEAQSLSTAQEAALQLAVERLEHMKQLEAALGDKQARNQELEERVEALEALAYARLEQLERLDAQLGKTAEALAHAGNIVGEQSTQLTSHCKQIEALERLALQRQEEIERLALQRQQLESLALQRHEEIQLLALQRQEMETLALQRHDELQLLHGTYRQRSDDFARLEQQMLARDLELSAGLSRAEHFAVSRLEQINALDTELKQTAAALAQAETLAFERLAELEKMRHESD